MKRILTSLIFSTAAIIALGEHPMAILKAQYTEWNRREGSNDKQPYIHEDKFILQIGNGSSYFYDPQTFYIDSLENDPSGRVILDQALADALREFSETGADAFAILEKAGLMSKSHYKCRKQFSDNLISVWQTNGADEYEYTVDMNELNWELCDSTHTVLDYECNLASAYYHGRKWKAWFATDIPVQDGPWQLCGLPGLIMKAETEDGEYGFIITGLQQCNETFKPVLIDPDKLYKTKRKTYLKMRDYGRRNRSAQISAMTNGAVKVNVDYTGKDDFLETDYHE
ncbi:MAG: GLPGLI family protein [Muribaculaceae bacterium]|nr:GLPGLI family protein [Muribaculaceae bacterium]